MGEMRKFLVIGGNSKLFRGILGTNILNVSFTIKSIKADIPSLDENNNKGIMWFSGITDTEYAVKEQKNLLWVNCYKLAKFLLNNLHQRETQFIYFSTVKCISYIKKDILDDISAEIVNSIIRGEEYPRDDVIEKFNMLLETLHDSYALSKAIAEKIIGLLWKNHTIIRCDYVIGNEEDDNVVAKQIGSIIRCEDIILPRKRRSFITYKDLGDILSLIIQEEKSTIKVFDLFGDYIIDCNEFSDFFSEISVAVCSSTKIGYVEKGKECIGTINDELRTWYWKKTRKSLKFRDIRAEIMSMFYRIYIRDVLHYTIIKEWVGGSYAYVYQVEKLGLFYSLKIALGNGADNGAAKLMNETRQLISIRSKIKHFKDSPDLIPVPIHEVYSRENFAYVVSSWVKGKHIYEEIIRGADVAKSIYKIIIGIQQYYSHSLDNFSINILRLTRKRVKHRFDKIKNRDSFLGKIIEEKIIRINGGVFDGPSHVFENVCNKIKLKDEMLGVCISGDAIFDNFVLEENGDRITVLDSRGEDLLWGFDGLPYFYQSYDFGKMLFYFLGWKIVREDLMTCHVGDEMDFTLKCCSEISESLMLWGDKTFQCIFEEVNKNAQEKDAYIKQVLFLLGVHFMCDAFPRLMGKGDGRSQCMEELLIGTVVLNVLNNNIGEEGKVVWGKILAILKTLLLT